MMELVYAYLEVPLEVRIILLGSMGYILLINRIYWVFSPGGAGGEKTLRFKVTKLATENRPGWKM